MGLHIFVVRVLAPAIPSASGSLPTHYAQSEELPEAEWDSSRHRGDGEFAGNEDLEWVLIEREADEDLWRPADFAQARQWVRDQLAPAQQPRLLMILGRLEQEPDLWFFFG